MEKKLYFCDCCGKELEEGNEFYTIDIEGSVMVKHPLDNCLSINSNREKQYFTLYVEVKERRAIESTLNANLLTSNQN